MPATVDRATFQAELDGLRVREKAHTREGDAIAAARRRLPMVEVDANLELIGPHGPLTLLDAFEGRRQLIAYYFMWHPGQPAAEQCEGCTWCTTQVAELSYLHSRDITYAVFCQGPYDESIRYRDFMGWDMPWYSAQRLPRRAPRRAPHRHDAPRVLPAGRRPRLRDLLDDTAAAWRPWTTATRSWTSPCTDARSRGRTRPPAGHSSGRSTAPTRGSTDAPSPSGRDSRPDAPTTSPPGARDERPGTGASGPARGADQPGVRRALPADARRDGRRHGRAHAVLDAPRPPRRTEVEALAMATTMVAGMAVWMAHRLHTWPEIIEMSAAMYGSFAVLFPFLLARRADPDIADDPRAPAHARRDGRRDAAPPGQLRFLTNRLCVAGATHERSTGSWSVQRTSTFPHERTSHHVDRRQQGDRRTLVHRVLG